MLMLARAPGGFSFSPWMWILKFEPCRPVIQAYNFASVPVRGRPVNRFACFLAKEERQLRRNASSVG